MPPQPVKTDKKQFNMIDNLSIISSTTKKNGRNALWGNSKGVFHNFSTLHINVQIKWNFSQQLTQSWPTVVLQELLFTLTNTSITWQNII